MIRLSLFFLTVTGTCKKPKLFLETPKKAIHPGYLIHKTKFEMSQVAHRIFIIGLEGPQYQAVQSTRNCLPRVRQPGLDSLLGDSLCLSSLRRFEPFLIYW
jgi:hypothetical protein